jgi:large subunit ribosomal protein L29
VKAEKLRESTTEELKAKLETLRDEVFRMRIKHATGQLDQAVKLRATKKDVARVLTILSERHAESGKLS